MQLMPSVTEGARAKPKARNPSAAAPAAGNPMRQLLLDLTRAPPPTFENFVHGRNAELFGALQAAARDGLPEPVLYVWGESGAGKTHLLTAFREATEGRAGIRVIDDVERLGEDEQAALFNDFVVRA